MLPALVSCWAGCTTGAALVAHHFDESAEGWVIAGDTGDVEPSFETDGGSAGGYISGNDEALGETWYFRAPEDVLTALPAAADGTISYRLRQSSTDAGFDEDDLVITGPAGRLSFRFDYAPGTDWTPFTVRLSASEGWRWNWSAAATDEQLRSVLADAARFEIRGEYRTGEDVGGLDDFVLTGGG